MDVIHRCCAGRAYSLLDATYHTLKHGQSYSELSADYLANLDPRRQTRYFVNRLERLGYEVTLAQEKPAA